MSQSAAVIIGTVTNAQAHLSADKSYVYSEFDVLVDEVIKDDVRSPIATGKTVPVERPGGRVLVPSGHIHEYRTSLNPLGVGSRYALFLTRRGNDYHVFTGYKLEAGVVFPVDDYFTRYEGVSEEEFMRDLRQAVTSNAETQRSTEDTSPIVYQPVEPPDPDAGGDCQLPAQPSCVTPQNDLRPRFSPGTVTVTYNPDHFSAAEVNAFRNGYMVWNNLGNVTFTEPTPNRNRPTGGGGNTLHFESTDQPTSSTGDPRDARVNHGETCFGGTCHVNALVILKRGLSLTARAWCQNGGYIDYNDYEQLVAHEVGHPLGLRDTYTENQCCRGISIMDGESYHLRNSTITECDKQSVVQAYPKPAPTPTPTPTCQDADNDGACSDVDCNDLNPNVISCSDVPQRHAPYFQGYTWTCYNVYEEQTYYTCVDGGCSDPRTEYVLVYSYCTY